MARSSGKAGMSNWKEGQRRSPRISALDACKAQQSRRVGRTALTPQSQAQAQAMVLQEKKTQGPATRTRARKTRKIRPLEDVAATSLSPFAQQGSNQQSHEDHPISSDQPTSQGANSPAYDDKAASRGYMHPDIDILIADRLLSVPSTKWMPEKRILELILDILQRRDTYEIFSEPVDTEEVEDYYEIIKEPMDFGTMRAKLHEGMYTSLQQFEHDVYLISSNAMHFNSSATIYFRQARAIHELAKKVFHALKTDPDNFELEFSDTRRRTSRRLMSEARAPSYSSSSKLTTNLIPKGKTNISSKNMSCFLRNSSNRRKSIGGIHRHSGSATDLNARDLEVHSGAVTGWRNSFAEVDRRCTYRTWMSVLSEKDSMVSTVYSNSKPLIPVDQQDIGYRDSLMFFVKDLGPTAQMIAKRKLIGCSADASTCWSPGRKASARDQMLIHSASVEVASSSNERKIPVGFRGDALSGNAVDVFGLSGCDMLHQDQCSECQLDSYPSSVGAKEFNLSVAELKNLGKNSTPIMMVKSNCYSQAPQLESSLAQSETNRLDLRSRNNYKLAPSWPERTIGSSIYSETEGSGRHKESPLPRSGGQDINAKHEVRGSVDAGQDWKTSQPMQVGSQFIFDLPFLRKRLDQINLLGKDKVFQQGPSKEVPFLNKVSWKRQLACTRQKELLSETYNDSYKQLSLDAQHEDLAIQW